MHYKPLFFPFNIKNNYESMINNYNHDIAANYDHVRQL